MTVTWYTFKQQNNRDNTMSRVVQQLKGYITKRIGHPIWQKLFYDHVICNREDYEEHTKYICENPINWQLDELYANEQL